MATLSSPTLQRLITSVRYMLNQPDRNNSFWTDEELTEYLNEAIRLYFLEVVQSSQGQFTTTASLDIVSDAELIALPTDCFEVKSVRKKVSGGYVPLNYRNNINDGISTQGGTSAETFFPDYGFRGNSIALNPIPNFSETSGILLEYVQLPDNLVSGGDIMTNQVSPIFRQLIEMYAVYKAKLKESLVNGVAMHSVAESSLSSLYLAFKEAVTQRSMQPTFTIPFDPEST